VVVGSPRCTPLIQPRSNRLTPRAPDDRRLDSSGWIVPRRRRAGAALDYVGCGRWQPTAGTLAGRQCDASYTSIVL